MIRLLIILLTSFLFRLSFGAALESKPAVTFQVKHAGLMVNGSFGGLRTDLRFNPQRLEESKLAASVAVSTVSTGIKLRDNHLQKKSFFDAAQHLRIHMVSKRLESRGGNQYLGVFALTIRDTTRELAIPFTCVIKDSTGRFKAEFTINRQDFGVGGNSLIMAEEVAVCIDLEAPLQGI